MFRETISNVLLEQVPRATQASPGVLFIITLCTLWAFWRIWTFTIVPILRPDEPKDIPYWVPCEPFHDLIYYIKICSKWSRAKFLLQS